MNPPAAIQNAMARERKPFTYTPGGLDLSEIKSERMARRLMRNAMSQGVPEVTSPSAQSPTTLAPSFPQAAHYMNLPVQVFPAFQLPANPKSLLRTRSQPYQPRESSIDRNQPAKEQYAYAAPMNGTEARASPVTDLPPLPRRNSTELSAAGLELYLPTRLSTSPAPVGRVAPQALSPLISAQTAALSEDRWFDCSEDRLTPNIVLEPCLKMPSEILQSNTEDKKVKSKKKTPSKEAASEENVEVEATIKVTKPKKTISTAVEIERKILPNGKVEETKTTTTNTIINGKVEDSKVQKETRILTDEEAKAVIQEESEEEEEEVEEQEEVNENSKKSSVQQNGTAKEVITETRTETKKTVTTTETKEETKKPAETKEVKQIAAKQAPPSEDEEEEEAVASEKEEEEVEEEIVTKPKQPEPSKEQVKLVKEQSEEEEEEEEEEEVVEEKVVKEMVVEKTINKAEQVNGTQESEEEEEDEEEEEEKVEEKKQEVIKKVETKESEPEESEPSSPVPAEKTETKEELEEEEEEEEEVDEVKETKQVPQEQPRVQEVEKTTIPKEEVYIKTETPEIKPDSTTLTQAPEQTTTSKTETTEITSSVSEDAQGHPVSTQTELHRVENVTVTNRTTKSLDNTYEQLTQHGVPTVRTYFAPPNRERISTSPQPAKPYTPTFTPERKQPERRHSLLLDRLSTERQVAPPESYQNTYNYQSNQSYDQVTNQWGQEPQSEVVIASNVKPSSINNSQWYQTPQPQPQAQPQPNSNIIYNNVQPTTPSAQPSYQKPSYDSAPYTAPAYQPEVPSYTSKPSTWGSSNLGNLDRLPSLNAQSNQYSFMSNKSTTESYSQQSTGTQQYSTGYVPPPWENDQSVSYQPAPSPFYQPQSTTPAATPTGQPSWTPTPQQPKYSKAPPLSYQPPAPNQSFVKKGAPGHTSEPGRKTYYSEYERRYISVPESTYIPTETKVQPQWDASPHYYYDNPEPTEEVEQPWRKELREFTEKSTKVEETTVVQPPWSEEAKYPKTTAFSPQPNYNQTLRPRSWRERSYDESLQQQSSQEWSKTSTLNRRPVSAFVKTRLDSPSYDRARGVSVDRYNVNSYQSPASYAPASNNGYTLPWEIQEQPTQASQQYSDQQQQSAPQPSKTYHNPQVPAYHVRPTESRDYQINYQPRWSGMGRERPVQSRSFKYLQMLTGTEDGIEEPEPFVVQQPHHSAPRPRRV